MRTSKFIACAALALAASLGGCSSSNESGDSSGTGGPSGSQNTGGGDGEENPDGTGTPNPTSRLVLRATVNGMEVVPDDVEAKLLEMPDGTRTILIIGDVTRGSYRRLLLSLSAEYGAGSYPLSKAAHEAGEHYVLYEVEVDEQSLAGVSASGSLDVTEHDKATRIIKGNFHFVTESSFPEVDKVEVTDGTFEVEYTPVPGT